MSDFEKTIEQFKCNVDDKPKDPSVKSITTSSSSTDVSTTNTTNPTITLSNEQKIAYRKFINGENIFITGPGGTGKTHLIRHLIKFSNSINKNIPVCAMTGCAAVLLECNARTLHSWSGIKLAKGTKDMVINNVIKNKHAIKTWKLAKGIILDEVSMLSKKVFEIIENIARIVKKDPRPFGGMQVVFTGDFFQLPPVGNNEDTETSQFCFESPRWEMVFSRENHIELTTMFRQSDPLYIDILRQIRKGYLDQDKQTILKSYVNRQYESETTNGCVPTKLFPLRSKTDYVNSMMFKRLTEKEYVFETIRKTDCTTHLDSTKPISFEEMRKCRSLNEREIGYELDLLSNSIPSSQIIRLKKGAIVMCTVNLDMDNAICNGSQGIVIDIKESPSGTVLPTVRFSNGIEKTISPHFWQSEEYPTIAVGQYPLCLAWALTIHKIQGATLTMAEMDIGQSIFEYGQTYVALSRIKSLDGLYLSAFYSKKISANPKVAEFYKNMSTTDIPISDKIDNTLKSTQTLDANTQPSASTDVKIIKL